MEDIVYYSGLYDYYGSLLTSIQQEYFENYYFNNLSLQEIADEYKVSKNAISKTLLDVNKKLDDYESKLKLYSNKEKIVQLLTEEEITKIEHYI